MTHVPVSPRELMRRAMRRQATERIPTMPQICHDLPVRLYASETGGDWLDALQRCVQDPTLTHDLVIRLVEEVDCDGLRLFVTPPPLEVERVDDTLVVVEPETGDKIGCIDAFGGGRFVPDRPLPPIETRGDAEKRLAAMVHALTPEGVEGLRNARLRVPDRFVASSPGGITMNTYTALRGREQAMTDLVDRPDFVSAVMDLQADAVIQRAEKLLATGIDAFYIGDPAASGSLIGPWHFEQFCLPAYQKFCRHFSATDILIYIHVCGDSNPILEMLAATGAHVVEPLDPLGGVSVADAKRRIGDQVALMGGVNTLTLSRGSPEDVTQEAIRKCRDGGPTGYILAAGDMVPPDTSMENLRALVTVAKTSMWR